MACHAYHIHVGDLKGVQTDPMLAYAGLDDPWHATCKHYMHFMYLWPRGSNIFESQGASPKIASVGVRISFGLAQASNRT
jgi:hypothetical protein